LFGEPLVTEVSWLLPLVFLGFPVALVATGWSWPLSGKHTSLLLWVGWLLPAMAYFSFTTGLFHRYYLIMLGPPLAALVGITFWGIAQHWKNNHNVGWIMAAFLTGLTLIFEVVVFRNYPDYAGWVAALSVLIWLAGIGVLALKPLVRWQKVGLALVLSALLVAPLTWSALTTFNTRPNVGLPTAGVESADQTRSTFMTPDQELLDSNGQAILAYTLANTDPESYLLATNNARGAAPYILETDRAVLTFGGFSGGDAVVGLADLIEMTSSGELRYILGLPENKPEISRWIVEICSVAQVPGLSMTPRQQPGAREQNLQILYDCALTS